jgi:hypothetical protein
VLRAAYEAIPEHFRRYALGDMDRKDAPLRVLCAGVGGRLDFPSGDTRTVTEQLHQEALDYFAGRQRERDKWEQRTYPDGPEGADSPTVHLNQVAYPNGWPEDPGALALRNEYPAVITIDSVSYPTVVHAYWALAAADPATAGRSARQTGPTTRRNSPGKPPSARTGRPSGSRSWRGCCAPSSPSIPSLPKPCWPPATAGSSTPVSARATGTPGAARDATGWDGCSS